MTQYTGRWLNPTLLRRTGILLLIATIVVMAILWFMFQHKPRWYQPVQLDTVAQKQARKEAINFIDFVGHQMVGGKAFDLVLDENRLNKWLGMMPEFAMEEAANSVGRFTQPAIQFADDRLRFGAQYQQGGLRVIVSATVLLSVGSDNRTVLMKMENIQGGSLPAPRRILNSLLETVLQKAQHRSGDEYTDQSISAVILEKVETVDDLFEGVVRRNRFVWPNGRRLFSFESIEIRDSEMRMRIKPL